MKKKMINNVLICSFILIFATAGFSATSYPLRCRGGVVDLRVGCLNGTMTYSLSITLNRASSHTNVGMDQCAWLDRALNMKEIPVLKRKDTKGRFKIKIKHNHIYKIVINDQALNRVLNAIRNGQEYFVHVVNSGSHLGIKKFGL